MEETTFNSIVHIFVRAAVVVAGKYNFSLLV